MILRAILAQIVQIGHRGFVTFKNNLVHFDT